MGVWRGDGHEQLRSLDDGAVQVEAAADSVRRSVLHQFTPISMYTRRGAIQARCHEPDGSCACSEYMYYE